MRTRTAQVTISIVCLMMGIMLVIQFRTQSKIQRTVLAEPATNQAVIISGLYDGNITLRREVDSLAQQLEQYDRSSERSDLAAMAEELDRLRVVTGLTPVSGPGVELHVDVALAKEDVQDLINELRNAGAEALALNEQRLVVKSAVYEQRGTIYVNGAPLQQPYVFQAIGHPDTIERALVRKGGVLTIIENAYPGAIFDVAKRDRVDLPVYEPGYRWSYATPAAK